MFDGARNRVAVLEDDASVTNRTRLLLLSCPGQLYNGVDFGVGLPRTQLQYNTPVAHAVLEQRIKDQLAKYEPMVYPEMTVLNKRPANKYGDINGDAEEIAPNKLEATVAIVTRFSEIEVDIRMEDSTEGSKTRGNFRWSADWNN
jgi:hypothetical protein